MKKWLGSTAGFRSCNCHENGESAHEKSTTYEQIAIFMLRGVPEVRDACRQIPITLKTPEPAFRVLFGGWGF
jgi:hypothetical protein